MATNDAINKAIQAIPDEEFLKLDNKLCFMLYACSRAMTKKYRPLLEPLGLTYPQYLVMLVLWESDPETGLKVTELGERLHLDSGTLTPLLKRLESSGLVIRERGVEDERAVYVRLNEASEALRAPVANVSRELLCSSGASVDEVKAMRDLLNQLLDTLER